MTPGPSVVFAAPTLGALLPSQEGAEEFSVSLGGCHSERKGRGKAKDRPGPRRRESGPLAFAVAWGRATVTILFREPDRSRLDWEG